ncbi:hypothetical protein J2Z69_000628 [Paenibacillus shirakamiensis]|uniref:SLH domain-containing protein n=1 Tax=Paenibacillus shirakamiensis TaxID=1265935 RepID=A0ABS4JD21_9BACL|nr:S-layer homology domain-containing protein [Paenibacillus shirakamiensis]MBP1999609.1 hypothetical protein [Paenibacillus shirakamiensis]
MSYKRSYMRQTQKAMSAMLVTAISLSGGTAAFAATSTTPVTTAVPNTTVSTGIFTDVTNGYWAEKHIYKLAAQGIILGDKGKFRPNDNITQQEAVALAIRFMNAGSKLPATPSVPDKLKTGVYFKPYVALALELKLLDSTEELAATSAKDNWGEKKASREWIAKILVRALGKDADAKAAATKQTTFADNNKISVGAKGAVNVAVDLGLAKGVEGNRFDPLGLVTRAQIAAFFGRGQAYVNPGYANVYEGIVTALSNNQITLYIDGKSRSFVVDNRSVVYSSDADTKKNINDIKLYTKVVAIDKTGSAAYIEVTDSTPQLESIQGTFAKTTGNNTIWLSTNTGYVSYGYDEGTTFLDQNGKSIGSQALTADSTVEIQRETYSPAKRTISIKVKSGLVTKEGTGTIQSLDNNTLIVKDTAGLVEQFKVDPNVLVRYQNQIISLSELKAGAAIKYSIKNSVITSIEVTQSVERTFKAQLIDIGAGNKLVTYKKTDGTLESKLLADKASIAVDGIVDAGLNDLIADVSGGDQVQITLDAGEKVNRIQVIGRQSEQLSDLTVVSYDSALKALTLVDANKKLQVYALDEKTKLDYNSSAPTLTGMESLLTKGRKISLNHIGNRILSLQVVYKYEGTFVSANATAKTITLQMSGGKTVVVNYTGTQPSIELYGKASPSLNDIKVGDAVTAILTANQDALQTLAVTTPIQFEVISVDSNNSRIRAESSGITDEIYVDKATLLGASGGVLRLTDITAGQFLNVVFQGRTAISVQAVKLTLGKVQSVDGSSVTIKDFTGNTTSFPVTAGIKVVKAGATSTNASTLTASDHVEVRKDQNGQLVFTVLSTLLRPFNYYDSSTKEMFVKRDFNDTQYRFSLSLDAYIHQGDTTLTVQSLKENDNIVLYFNRGKLVEIEKQ